MSDTSKPQSPHRALLHNTRLIEAVTTQSPLKKDEHAALRAAFPKQGGIVQFVTAAEHVPPFLAADFPHVPWTLAAQTPEDYVRSHMALASDQPSNLQAIEMIAQARSQAAVLLTDGLHLLSEGEYADLLEQGARLSEERLIISAKFTTTKSESEGALSDYTSLLQSLDSSIGYKNLTNTLDVLGVLFAFVSHHRLAGDHYIITALKRAP